MYQILLSLCIPTNGIAEWVFPVIDSIYSQAVDFTLFEVVVTDNGSDSFFYKEMTKYVSKYSNLVYSRNGSNGFTNQIDCFKQAKGELIKFVNHRMALREGTLDYLIEFCKIHKKQKPPVYFSNGELMIAKGIAQCEKFDAYVKSLGYWSSWSAGVAIWKKDLESIDFNKGYSSIFPHTIFVFCNDKSTSYIIDDQALFVEITTNQNEKGKYNIFYAFAIEYPNLLMELLVEKKISTSTFLSIKKALSSLLSTFYIDYIIRRVNCSYMFDEYKTILDVYFNHRKIMITSPFVFLKKKFRNRIMRK